MIKVLKKNKIMSITLLLTILSSISGIIFNTLLSPKNKTIINNNIELLVNNKLYNNKLLITNNLITTIIIWILGISIIGIIVILVIYLFKVFIFSFETISLISNLKFKNILLISVYTIPNIVNIVIYYIISYYAISYSIYLIRNLFFNKKYNMYIITKKYILILIIGLIIITISTIIEILILPHLKEIKI